MFFKQSEADQWVRDIPKQLKAGKAVTLIGPTGGPKWSRWARPTYTALPKGEKGKPFRMAGFDLMLLELVPDPGVASYRFRAEVKHIDGQVPYRVGLYFSQTKQATTEDDANLFLELTYTDMNIENPTTGNNIVRVLADLVREPGPGVIINFFSGTALFFKHSPDLKKPWRQLAVEATQEGYQVFWENQLVEKLSWTELNETGKAGLDGTIDFGNAVNPSLNALRTVNPAYGPLQGLGLYCNESVAEFRNVILEPIPSKQP
ncbi:MAG: hypothetical protein HY260_11130 [Chloroflexi bacterium]|nr:hypothetical protein [Chloroflexota bacterium]